jgi:hypothetical protein
MPSRHGLKIKGVKTFRKTTIRVVVISYFFIITATGVIGMTGWHQHPLADFLSTLPQLKMTPNLGFVNIIEN